MHLAILSLCLTIAQSVVLILPSAGTFKEGVYSSTYFGFWCRVPPDFEVETNSFRADVEKSVGKSTTGIHVLLYAGEQQRFFKAKESVTIYADHIRYYGRLRTANDYLEKVTRYYRGEVGFELLREPRGTAFGGKRFFRGDYKKPGVAPVYLSAVVTARRGYVITFLFTAGSAKRINELVEGLNLLKFRE